MFWTYIGAVNAIKESKKRGNGGQFETGLSSRDKAWHRIQTPQGALISLTVLRRNKVLIELQDERMNRKGL
jgi:hypothetical protein